MKPVFIPTAHVLRAHPALTRLWRSEFERKERLKHIFLQYNRHYIARDLGWEEFGNLSEMKYGRINRDTFAGFGMKQRYRCYVLKDGPESFYLNCLKGASSLGMALWANWQGVEVSKWDQAETCLLSEMENRAIPERCEAGSLTEFWSEIERKNCFIWILRLDGIGDLLITLGILKAHKAIFPKRRFGLIVNRRYADWLKEIPWIDRVVSTDVLYWSQLEDALPPPSFREAWINPMTGDLRVAGNHVLASRYGPSLTVDSHGTWAATHFHGIGNNCVSLLCKIFGVKKPSLPWSELRNETDNKIAFNPFPGGEERLWPPDCWGKALEPLKGETIRVETPTARTYKRWLAEFEIIAQRNDIRIERYPQLNSPLDTFEMIASCRAWVGVNSSPMHVAGLLGLPSVAIGRAFENNAFWIHPGKPMEILDSHEWALDIMQFPTSEKIECFRRTAHRNDHWADAIFVDPGRVHRALEEVVK